MTKSKEDLVRENDKLQEQVKVLRDALVAMHIAIHAIIARDPNAAGLSAIADDLYDKALSQTDPTKNVKG